MSVPGIDTCTFCVSIPVEYMFSLLSNLYHSVDSDNYSRRSKNRDINKHVSPYVCFVFKDFISVIFFLNSTLRVREV